MENFVKNTKLYLFDMDGTLYLGEQLFDFTGELLAQIRRTRGRYLFITNNSSKSVADYVRKMRRLGIETTAEDFMTSAQATAFYLKKHHPGKKLYVCGTESFKEELRGAGFEVTQTLEQVQCVVMGFDTELTFQKLEDVCRLLCTRKDIPYIASHPDLCCPTEYGSVIDCGSICAGIKNATGREPVVVGKPQPLMVELAMEAVGCTKEETAVIGDRIHTDVMSGLNAGAKGVLVLTGESTWETLEKSDVKPSLVLESAGQLLPYLRAL